MPNVKLIRAILVYYNMFKFQVDWAIIFWVIVYTDRHTDGDEYSIVAVDKPQL